MIEQDRSTSFQDPASPNLSFNSQGPFIERAPHSRNNRYTMVSNELLRNAKLSFACRAFICYLLSFDETWRISIPWVMKTQQISRRKMYRMIDEARKLGYLYRERTRNEKGHIIIRYFVAETPIYEGKFDKIPHVHYAHAVNVHTKKEQQEEKTPKGFFSSSSEEQPKEKKTKSFRCALAPKTTEVYESMKAEKLAKGYTETEFDEAWRRYVESEAEIGNVDAWMDKTLKSVRIQFFKVQQTQQKKEKELRLKNEPIIQRFIGGYKGPAFWQVIPDGVRINDRFFRVTDEDLESKMYECLISCEKT